MNKKIGENNMKTDELIHVLKEHNHVITKVEIGAPKDCKDFWRELTSSVYYRLSSEQWDYRVNDSMTSFAEVDSLEIVNKAGRILKRFSKHFKTEQGIKLPDDVAGIIGDKIQYYIQKATNTFYADFTDVIDWHDGKFGKDGSCWWGTYSQSQDVFIDNGGWGIRFYDNEQDEQGIGRTWILPRDNMLLCFNSYGVSRAQTSKVIKAIFSTHGIKLHYKQASIENSQNDCIPYINGDSGFVLYPDDMNPDDVPSDYDVDMEVEDDERENCYNCGDRTDRENGMWIHDDFYCDDCVSECFTFCDNCEEYCDNDDCHSVRDEHSRYSTLCRYCAESRDYALCYECDQYSQNYVTTEDTGDSYCSHCQDGNVHYCESCGEYNTDEHNHDDEQEESEDNTVSTEIDASGLIESVESVKMYDSNEQGMVYKTVTVYRVPDVQGIYLFNASQQWEGENWYNITHDDSGLGVRTGIASFDTAKKALFNIAHLMDWNRPKEAFLSDTELMNTIQQAIHNTLHAEQS